MINILILICPGCRIRGRGEAVKKILKSSFRCRLAETDKEQLFSRAYYSFSPHIILLDADFKDMIFEMKKSHSLSEKLSRIPFIILLPPGGDEREAHLLPFNVRAVVRLKDKKSFLIREVKKAAASLNFKLLTGKIKERLGKFSIPVKIKSPLLSPNIIGKTTGINSNGLGARVRAAGQGLQDIKRLINTCCRVEFEAARFSFLPADIIILRVEKSRQLGYDAFLAASFKEGRGLDSASAGVLRRLIESQEDESIIKRGIYKKKKKLSD